MSHNFLKYAPLRMKPRNTENPISGTFSNESLVGNSRHFGSAVLDAQVQSASRPRLEISSSVRHQMQLEEPSMKDEDADAISLENINVWFQRQERRTSELQKQLEASIAKNNWLKLSLEKAQKEVQELQNLNKTLQDSHAVIQTAVKNAEKLFAEVNENVSKAKHIVDEVKQDRETWLNNLKECQRSHFDRRVMLLHSDYQKTISEKDAELASKQSRLDVLEAELTYTAAKVDSLQHELLALKSELDKTNIDKKQLHEERHKLEAECKKLNQGLDEVLSERTAKIIEDLSKERECSTLAANNLKECQDKLIRTESRLEAVIRELQLLKKEELEEPKEKLRTEISSLKSEILQLSNTIIGYKKSISSLQEDLLVAQETNHRLDEANRSLPLLSKERTALQEKFVSLEKQNESLNAILTETSAERDLYKGMIEERDTKLSQANTLNADLEGKVQILINENNDLKVSMSLTKKENEELAEKVTTVQEINKELQDVAEERGRTLDETMKNYEEAQKSLNDAKKEISDLKRELMGCHLKLDYANERLNQMENEDSMKHKVSTRQVDRCPETTHAKSLKLPSGADVIGPLVCSHQPDNGKTSQYSNDCFVKPDQRAIVVEFPSKPTERIKEKESGQPPKEASGRSSRSLNPLELLEKADAIVAKEKVHHHSDDNATTRKVLALADSEIWKHHQKKQKLDHDATAGNWECPVAPSPVIKTNWKY